MLKNEKYRDNAMAHEEGIRTVFTMKKRLLPLLAAWTLLASVMSGCAAKKENIQFFAMDTVMDITAYGPAAEQALPLAERRIYELDAAISAQDERSEISRLNAGSGEPLSETVRQLVRRALEAARVTDGAYDPTVGALMELWGFGTDRAAVPAASEIENSLGRTGWQQLLLTDSGLSMPEGFCFDPGGIGKGYAAEQAKALLKEQGVRSAILSLGGNVSVLGAKPDGSDWVIGIQDPQDAAANFALVRVKDAAVVTSGGYQRYFEEGGRRYCHILDPQTGYPAQSGLLSVTIVSQDDTMADALSTALYVMGAEKAEGFWRESGLDFGCVIMDQQRHVFVTEDLADTITCTGGFELWTR